jgi:hypothetical protein
VLRKPQDLPAETPAESLLQKHEGVSSSSSGSDSQASGGSDASEHEDVDMPDPKVKAAPKKRGRRPDAQQIKRSSDHVSWLRSLLQDLSVPVPAESESVDQQQQEPQFEEAAVGVSLAAAAANLVEEAFEMSSSGNHDTKKLRTDELEEQEEKYAEEMSRESGLDEMQERERKMIALAHEEFKKLGDKQAMKSPIAEPNLAQSIHEIMAKSGISEEEAAEEAILGQHQLLGNEKAQPESEQGVPSSGFQPNLQSSSSSSGVAAPQKPILEGHFGNWMEECFASCEALMRSKEAGNTLSVGQGGELSLVMGRIRGEGANSTSTGADNQDPESVFWVHWSDSAARLGRPATLDKDNRVKCIVPTGPLREKRDYKSAKIFHPAIGVRMERVRGFAGFLRPSVPAKVLRLSDVWKEVLTCRGSSSSETLGLPTSYAAAVQSECPCYVCGSSASRTSDDESMGFDVVRTCPLCLLAAHTACRDSIAEFGVSEGFGFQGREGRLISNFLDVLQGAGGLLKEVFGDSYRMSLD